MHYFYPYALYQLYGCFAGVFVLLYNGKKGELPVVDIDKSIPSIALELDYDKFDEEEL